MYYVIEIFMDAPSFQKKVLRGFSPTKSKNVTKLESFEGDKETPMLKVV